MPLLITHLNAKGKSRVNKNLFKNIFVNVKIAKQMGRIRTSTLFSFRLIHLWDRTKRLTKPINDFGSLPGPVAIPRSKIQGHANSLMARAARLLCL